MFDIINLLPMLCGIALCLLTYDVVKSIWRAWKQRKK